MQLDDRGINYQSHPPHLQLTEGVGEEYCGTWRQKYPRHICATQPRIDFKSSEVACGIDEPIDVAIPQIHSEATSGVVPKNNQAALNKSSRQQVLEELQSTHLNNIRRNLEHRLRVATEKGDPDLIRLLSAELEQIG